MAPRGPSGNVAIRSSVPKIVANAGAEAKSGAARENGCNTRCRLTGASRKNPQRPVRFGASCPTAAANALYGNNRKKALAGIARSAVFNQRDDEVQENHHDGRAALPHGRHVHRGGGERTRIRSEQCRSASLPHETGILVAEVRFSQMRHCRKAKTRQTTRWPNGKRRKSSG